ncbi:MAG: hypothetical protein JWO89_916 [Verrucomicrobiaceae bacterium]|nr:hypothetical protein [Verrucomicrobiaceae bacterium]
MILSYHPAAQRDVNDNIDHYRKEGGAALADRFFAELVTRLNEIAAFPDRFSFYLAHPFIRRACLHRFPHLILFRILRDRVRVTVIKHEKRDPNFGLRRK